MNPGDMKAWQLLALATHADNVSGEKVADTETDREKKGTYSAKLLNVVLTGSAATSGGNGAMDANEVKLQAAHVGLCYSSATPTEEIIPTLKRMLEEAGAYT